MKLLFNERGKGSAYLDEPLTEKGLDRLRKSVNCQSAYGSSMWQMKMGKELVLESTLRSRGRPREKAEKE